jgi:hypothetical protein
MLLARVHRRSPNATATRAVNTQLAAIPSLKTTSVDLVLLHAAGFARVAAPAWRARCRRRQRQVAWESWRARQRYLIGVPNSIKKTFGNDVTVAFGNARFTRTRGEHIDHIYACV